MASQAQIDANRKNAQKSTGPTTPEGRAKSSRNAIGHELCSAAAKMHGEDAEEFQLIITGLREEHQPDGPSEDILVYKMAESFWHSSRAAAILAERLDFNDQEDDSKQVSLMLRYYTTADRAFSRHLFDLLKLRKERRAMDAAQQKQAAEAAQQKHATEAAPEPNGFVSQDAEPEPDISATSSRAGPH